jgi:molecular chaperone GrpE (heat shock protein)
MTDDYRRDVETALAVTDCDELPPTQPIADADAPLPLASVGPEDGVPSGGVEARSHADSDGGDAAAPIAAAVTRGDDSSTFADAIRLLAGRVEALEAAAAGYHDRAAARERAIDRLHEENQRLRAGEHRHALRPVVADLCRLRNEMLGQAAEIGEPADRLLTSFAFSLELTLERCAVVPMRPDPGDSFDPRRHRAIGTAPADDPSADGVVESAVADGYVDTAEDRVLHPSTVKVYRWRDLSTRAEDPH